VYTVSRYSLLWQSKQARFARARVWGLSQGGSDVTGGLFPRPGSGTNWMSSPTTTRPIMTPKTAFFMIFSLFIYCDFNLKHHFRIVYCDDHDLYAILVAEKDTCLIYINQK
jgi:hypothetical protein